MMVDPFGVTVHPYKALLVPLDPCGCAEVVLARAIELAQALHARLVLLTVVNVPAGVHLDDLARGGTVRDNLRAEAETRLNELAALARPKVAQVDAVLRFGEIVPTVLAEVEAHGAGMIIMGTHGRTGLRRVLLGSVAESVIRQSSVPVVVIHAPEGTTDAPSRAWTLAAAEADG
jgi:nucleotide-binding universal stress UspA family protein